MGLVLESLLVGDHRKQPFEPLGRELGHVAAPRADEVPMLSGREQRLEALEAFPEVVRSHEPALEEHVERPVDGGRANAQALLAKATLDADDRKMLPTGKD